MLCPPAVASLGAPTPRQDATGAPRRREGTPRPVPSRADRPEKAASRACSHSTEARPLDPANSPSLSAVGRLRIRPTRNGEPTPERCHSSGLLVSSPAREAGGTPFPPVGIRSRVAGYRPSAARGLAPSDELDAILPPADQARFARWRPARRRGSARADDGGIGFPTTIHASRVRWRPPGEGKPTRAASTFGEIASPLRFTPLARNRERRRARVPRPNPHRPRLSGASRRRSRRDAPRAEVCAVHHGCGLYTYSG